MTETPAAELLPLSVIDYTPLIENLGVKHRAKDALRDLMRAGSLATPALCQGLRHANPVVRVGCCQVLDRCMDETALPELIVNLRHEDEQVQAGGHCTPSRVTAARKGGAVPVRIRLIPQAAHCQSASPTNPRRT